MLKINIKLIRIVQYRWVYLYLVICMSTIALIIVIKIYQVRLMRSSKKGKVIFTIDIKISGQQMSIPIYEGENHQQLIKRFCQQHVFKADYQQAIKDKIIQSLLATLKKAELSAQLKKKVNDFLNIGQKGVQKAHSRQRSEKSFRQNSDVSTPFKHLPQHNTNSANSHRKSASNRHVGAHQNSQKQRSLKQIQVKQVQKQACIRKNKVQPSKAVTSKSRLINSKGVDTDLIEAYEIIYKKSKQPQMKMMAKKFLQGCGAMKNQKASRAESKKIATFSVDSKNKAKDSQDIFQQNNCEKEPISKQNGSLIYSLGKFQAIDQQKSFQRSKSPPQPRNTPSKSPKQHRIKYDIGQYQDKPIGLERYDTEGINHSHYEHYEGDIARSSYRPRASLSYQKLPYFNQESEFEDRSFRNSRNIAAYPDAERAISLRRTRKYKYL